MKAFTVMVFVPVTSGTLADHAAAPLAVPELPVELLHVTLVVSAEAVPLIATIDADVETILKPGDVIFSAGGALEGGVGAVGVGVVGVVAVCRVTVSTRDALAPVPSVAITVTILVPIFNGTTGMLQLVEPLALPDGPWLLVQAICGVPDPPLAVPDIAIEELVTETADAAGTVTAIASADGAGVVVTTGA